MSLPERLWASAGDKNVYCSGKMTAIVARDAGRRPRAAQTSPRVRGNASSIPDVPGMVFVLGSDRGDDKGTPRS